MAFACSNELSLFSAKQYEKMLAGWFQLFAFLKANTCKWGKKDMGKITMPLAFGVALSTCQALSDRVLP